MKSFNQICVLQSLLPEMAPTPFFTPPNPVRSIACNLLPHSSSFQICTLIVHSCNRTTSTTPSPPEICLYSHCTSNLLMVYRYPWGKIQIPKAYGYCLLSSLFSHHFPFSHSRCCELVSVLLTSCGVSYSHLPVLHAWA